MSTDTFQSWFVATPAVGDASNRIANTLFVSQATIAIAQLASVASLTVLANMSTGISTVSATTVSLILDNVVGSAQGMVLLRSATSWTSLGPGTAGQLLQTLGSAANPKWVGGLVLLNTLSPSAVASANDTSSFTTTYRNYVIQFENVCPATNTTTLQMTVCTTGSAFISGNYLSIAEVNVSSVITTDTSTTVILLSGLRSTTQVASSTLAGVSGQLFVQNPAGTNLNKQFNGELSYQSVGALATTTLAGIEISGMLNLSTALTGMNFAFSSGNIQTGVIKIYGML